MMLCAAFSAMPCYAQPSGGTGHSADTLNANWRKDYDFYGPQRDGMICVRKDKKWGFVNAGGTLIATLRYDDAASFSEGRARIRRKGKWGYLNRQGREIIPYKYDQAEDFIKGRARVVLGGYVTYIDTMGCAIDANAKPDLRAEVKSREKADSPKTWKDSFDYVGPYNEGRTVVKLRNKCGYVNAQGRVVVPIIYDDAWLYSEGMARVKKGGLWGYIDSTGKEAIPFKYTQAMDFMNGRARVVSNKTMYYIDKAGNKMPDAGN